MQYNSWLQGGKHVMAKHNTASKNTLQQQRSLAIGFDLAWQQQAMALLETLVFLHPEPIGSDQLLALLTPHFSGHPLNEALITAWLQHIANQYHNRPIELTHTAQGYQFRVRAELSALINASKPDSTLKLSQSLLEMLSVIAYHQPVTRSDIEQIRGVSNNSQALKTLFEKGWISEKGSRPVPGQPALIVTTGAFLQAFCLPNLAALPPMQ